MCLMYTFQHQSILVTVSRRDIATGCCVLQRLLVAFPIFVADAVIASVEVSA